MLRQELIKLAKKGNTKSKDYKNLSRSERIKNSLIAGGIAYPAPFVIGEYGLRKSLDSITPKLIANNLTKNVANNILYNLEKYKNVSRIGSIGSFLAAMMSSPDSAVSKYAPLVGALSSVPFASEIIGSAKSRTPLALTVVGASALGPYLTRKMKEMLYKDALKYKNKYKGKK
jgi:hypothetical protein